MPSLILRRIPNWEEEMGTEISGKKIKIFKKMEWGRISSCSSASLCLCLCLYVFLFKVPGPLHVPGLQPGPGDGDDQHEAGDQAGRRD